MSEWIKNLFVAIFGSHSEIATIIISMIPIVELRGAIPFGSAVSFWGENALPIWQSFLYSVLGSTFVCVVLTFLFWPIFKWLKKTKVFKKLADAIENKIKKSSKNINDKVQSETNEKKTRWIKWLGVFAFVAIPLPLTGVWTGTCIALFIGMNKRDTMTSVILGNLVAGTIMTIISYFFADNTMIVLLVFFALVALFILVLSAKSIIKKIKNRKKMVGEVDFVKTSENTENIEDNDNLVNDENIENDTDETENNSDDETTTDAETSEIEENVEDEKSEGKI